MNLHQLKSIPKKLSRILAQSYYSDRVPNYIKPRLVYHGGRGFCTSARNSFLVIRKKKTRVSR